VRIAIDARAAAEVPAGRGRYVRELLRAIARAGRDDEYLLVARTRWAAEELDQRFRWVLGEAPGPAWPLQAGARMSRSADVALACTSYAMTLPWRIPGAAVVWDFAPFVRAYRAPRGSLLERLTLPIALRRCGALIAISEATRNELEQRYPRAAGRTAVATPGADERFAAGRVEGDDAVLARLGVTQPYVLATGTLEPRKNLPSLIEAFISLDPAVRAGWTLVLAGASGWATEQTMAAVSEHAGVVNALGYVPDEDLPALYRGASVAGYMSLYEGFGIPVLEAMQSGVAVLTSSVSSMPEVGGDAARYADPRDVADIARGLGELIADAGLRARCAEAGLQRAQLFDWQRTAGVVLDTLDSLHRG
jgi:glycosyltransferase involved in cell wall biosynthesis